MKTACSNCQTTFNSPQKYLGRRVKCPKCGSPFTVVAVQQVPTSQPAEKPVPSAKTQPTVEKAASTAQITPQKRPPARVAPADLRLKHCPFCAEEILAKARKCRHCGEWLDERMRRRQVYTAVHQQFSDAQPLWQLILLSIASFGIYQFVWFYKTWKAIKKHTAADFDPGVRTILLLVPFYNLYLIYSLFKEDLELLRESVNSQRHPPNALLLTAGFIALGTTGLVNGPLSLLCILSVCPLVVAQACLNHYWAAAQSDMSVRSPLPGPHIPVYIVGGLIWIPVLFFSLMPMNYYYYGTPAEQLAGLMRSHTGEILIQQAPDHQIEQIRTEMRLSSHIPDEDLSTAAQIAGHWEASVALITAKDKNGNHISQGSGFVITKGGAVATNYHVLENAHDAHVVIDGEQYDDVSLVKAYPSSDMAILWVEHKDDFTPIWLGDSDAVRPGDEVVAITNPGGWENTVTNGLISGIQQIEGIGMLQISAPISPGSSGGPIMNMRGQVVGIATVASVYLYQNINFAVPINLLKSFSQAEADPHDGPTDPNHL